MKMSSLGILSVSLKKSARSMLWLLGLMKRRDLDARSTSGEAGSKSTITWGLIHAYPNTLVDGPDIPLFPSLSPAAFVKSLRASCMDSSMSAFDNIATFPNPHSSAICKRVVRSKVRRERQKRASSRRTLGVMET